MFIKYPSIRNSYDEKFISKFTYQYPELFEELYVIMEKLHGFNFQIMYDVDSMILRFASRNRILDFQKDSFYGFQDAIMNVKGSIMNLLEDLSQSNRFIKQINIFGELFGGNTQKGVNYGENKKFRVFDIHLTYRNDDTIWLPHTTIEALCLDNYVEIAPVLARGLSLEEALKCNHIFDSNVLGVENNKAEGVVIKPGNSYFIFDTRFILKKKSGSFAEKSSSKKTPLFSEEFLNKIEQLQNIFMCYVTLNRVNNVLSKEANISKKNIGKYIGLIIEDAREEFLLEHKDSLKGLNKKEAKQVFKRAGKEIAKLLLTNIPE